MDRQGAKSPGEHGKGKAAIKNYVIGLLLAFLLTLASFWAAQTNLVYAPAVPVLLVTLAIGQIGVHLLSILHISSGPEDTNNVRRWRSECSSSALSSSLRR